MEMMACSNPTFVSQVSHGEEYEELTDEALLKILCCCSEERAMEMLYERYRRYVYFLAYRILGNSFSAEDVVQEVFFTLWQKASFYHEQQGSVKSWLQVIVRNRAIDKVRSSYYCNTRCVYPQELSDLALLSPEPELWEQAWQGERALYIHNALSQLSPEQRLVIELSYFAGYTHVEIAKRLELALGTVKGRLRLGLQKMKQLLQGYGLDVSGSL
jgi:RNA polymerase sigma-70 factor (ECF subfamily)